MRRLLCNAQAQSTFKLQIYLSTKLLSNSVVTKVTTLDANAQAASPFGGFCGVLYQLCKMFSQLLRFKVARSACLSAKSKLEGRPIDEIIIEKMRQTQAGAAKGLGATFEKYLDEQSAREERRQAALNYQAELEAAAAAKS